MKDMMSVLVYNINLIHQILQEDWCQIIDLDLNSIVWMNIFIPCIGVPKCFIAYSGHDWNIYQEGVKLGSLHIFYSRKYNMTTQKYGSDQNKHFPLG